MNIVEQTSILTPEEQKKWDELTADGTLADPDDVENRRITFSEQELGKDAQKKILGAILTADDLFTWAMLHVKPNYFEKTTHQTIYKVIQGLWKINEKRPSQAIVEIELDRVLADKDKQIKVDTRGSLAEAYQFHAEREERPYVEAWLRAFVVKSETWVAMTKYAKDNDFKAFQDRLGQIAESQYGENEFETYNATEFFEYCRTLKQDWLVDKWLPQSSLVLFSAQQKQGKSTVGFSLYPAIARGAKWLGEIATVQSSVLYLDYENPPNFVMENMLQYLPEEDWLDVADRLIIPHQLPRGLTAQWVRQLMKKSGLLNQPTGLIVIDSGRRAFNGLFPDVANWDNSASCVDSALRPFQQLARETGWSVLVIHHESKTGLTGGSVDWEAVPDFIWRLKQGTADTSRELQIKGRLMSKPEPLILEMQDCRLRLRGKKSAVKVSDERQAILDAIPVAVRQDVEASGGKGAITVTELKRSLAGKVGQNKIDRWLKSLIDAGYVSLVKLGKGANQPTYYWQEQLCLEKALES